MGLGGAFPNLLALVNESSITTRRNANVALAYSGMPFGGTVASLLSMSAPAHWRWIFLVGGGIPLILAPILLRVLRESSEFERVSSRSAVIAGLPAQTDMPKTGSFIAILTGGRVAPTLLLWTASFLGLLTVYLLLSWLPTLMTGIGLSKAQAAAVQVAFNVGGGLAALSIGPLLESKARNPSILVCFVAVPIFIVLLSQAPSQVSGVMLIVFGLGCAVLAAQGFLYTAAPRVYPTAIRGVGVGTAVAMGRIGAIVGPKLGGMLKAAGHNSSQLLLDILPLVVLGSVAALVFAWLISRRPDF